MTFRAQDLQEARRIQDDLAAECEKLARKRGIAWSRRVVGDPFRDRIDFTKLKLKETNTKYMADARKEAEVADKEFNDRMVCI